jgi:hypothetical protein
MSKASLGGTLAAFDGMYAFTSAVFSVPAGGTAGMLMESSGFGPLIKGSLLAASLPEFQTFLVRYANANGLAPEDAIVPAYLAFEAILDDTQHAAVNATFADFTIAAQTISDASDPNNFAALLGSNTKVLVHEVVRGGQNDDGSTALSDLTIPSIHHRLQAPTI